MVCRLGREHNTCAIIGDFNGRLKSNDPGAGSLILDLMCSKGWIPFLQTAVTETQLHPVRTYWKGGSTRTCPDHAFVHSTSEQLITPSGAYVLDGLSELSDGHHILGVAFHVADGPLPASMAVPKQHHTHRHRPPASAPALTNGACQVLNRTSLCGVFLRDSLKTWSDPLGIDLMTTQTGFFPRQLKACIK